MVDMAEAAGQSRAEICWEEPLPSKKDTHLLDDTLAELDAAIHPSSRVEVIRPSNV